MFQDTSGLLCLLHKDEPQHDEAVKLYGSARFRITTNLVLTEFVQLAQVRGLPRREALGFSQMIPRSLDIEVIRVDDNLHRRAIELLQ
jgi:uncharacterized protein